MLPICGCKPAISPTRLKRIVCKAYISSASIPIRLPEVFSIGAENNKQFKKAGRPAELAITPEEMQREVVDWVSAKNKFFTQVLRTKEPIATFELFAKRDLSQKIAVAAGLTIPSRVLNANDTSSSTTPII